MISGIHILRFKGIDDVYVHDLGGLNAFYGRNNSGKSTILHALDMAGLALSIGDWNAFRHKIEIKDLFHETGPFEIDITYSDESHVIVRQEDGGFGPSFHPQPSEEQRFKSIYIIPDPGIGLLRRQHRTPKNIMDLVNSRDFSTINGLEILYALKYYAKKRARGFKPKDYKSIIIDVMNFFPEVEELISDRTENDVATLLYQEYGKTLDVVYAGAGLQHCIDIFVKTTLSQASIVLIDEPEMGLHPSLQRELLNHLYELNQTKGTQFFIATHSPIFLADPEKVSSFLVQNRGSRRTAYPISQESIYKIWGDLGLRPGDLLQNDIVILVEGQYDVIFFEYVLHVLYEKDFKDIAIGIVQYAGDAASGIINGTIDISNIVPGDTYRLWIHDRDAPVSQRPHKNATKFYNALERHGELCHILKKREIDWYIPEDAHIAAQQGDSRNEVAIRKILYGRQERKFSDLVKRANCTLLRGANLRKHLSTCLSKDNLDEEIKGLVEDTLTAWRDKILIKGKSSDNTPKVVD